MGTEADTCRLYVVPKLQAAGWEQSPHSIAEQRTFTDGRLVPVGQQATRLSKKRADYLLRYTRDFTIAVVEAKAAKKQPGDGLQQAKEYAEILGLSFAYSTNGKGIVEFDFLTGATSRLESFPAPDELWTRLEAQKLVPPKADAQPLLAPANLTTGKTPRYYQEIAINRSIEAILGQQPRILLTLATGTGKTNVAFQICWKLWSSRWNASGEYRRPKILYLADRNILIDDPKDKMFAPFGDARWKIENGEAIKSREMYFAIYQAIARDERRPGLYREYDPDFFDLIIVDECHRGSAREESNWREILEYFAPAYQIGMTATPKRDDNINTYQYFGDALYEYSLRQGIEDGFLAPYRVYRVQSLVDAVGWRPTQDQLDRYGREIPDEEYQTRDFERVIALRARTEAFARHLTDFLKKTNRMAKTIVFCVDQEHALTMQEALALLNQDLVQRYPNYVARVTSDEGAVGRALLSQFQDPESASPVILTTSQLLTTGVDAPTCQNVVLARVVNSMTEFKQIIGRGTRVHEDGGKFFFNIIDYTGSATRLFADPAFDGYPEQIRVIKINGDGEESGSEEEEPTGSGGITVLPPDEEETLPTKYYVDGGTVKIVAEVVYELDTSGKTLRTTQLTDYTGETVRTLYRSVDDLRDQWADPELRTDLVRALEERGISLEALQQATAQPEADPFDLLCYLAFDAPLLTRRERAERLRREERDFFDQYGPDARRILDELLNKYAELGTDQFILPDALKVPPFTSLGNTSEILRLFGGGKQLRDAVTRLQALLYAA